MSVKCISINTIIILVIVIICEFVDLTGRMGQRVVLLICIVWKTEISLMWLIDLVFTLEG